jgi:hypothetical protein
LVFEVKNSGVQNLMILNEITIMHMENRAEATY